MIPAKTIHLLCVMFNVEEVSCLPFSSNLTCRRAEESLVVELVEVSSCEEISLHHYTYAPASAPRPLPKPTTTNRQNKE